MPHHFKGVYDCFDSLDEARQHYKRCRTLKDFILSDKGIQADNPTCAHCGNKLTDTPKTHPDVSEGYKGNRCHYHPQRKKSICLHYLCAWESLLNAIYAQADRWY